MPSFQDRLLPAPVDGGFSMPGQWVWCGSVARDDEGRYQMFASMWSMDVPFSPNWLTNSRVVRAVSDTPEGPYHYAGEVLPPRPGAWDGKMTHNPTIHRHGGTWYLFYTGSTYAEPMPTKGATVSPELRLEARTNQRIGLATAPAPEGPWTRLDAAILEPRPGHWDAMMTTNPAPCFLADGRVLLLYKSCAHDKSPIQYGVALAPSAAGPYERVSGETIFDFGDDIPYEDAYIWEEGGSFHMLFNDMTGKITGEDHAGAYATSPDGLTWSIGDAPKGYSREVQWADGRVVTQGSFERPQILVQDGVATHLFAATADGPGGFWRASRTWNMVRPLAPVGAAASKRVEVAAAPAAPAAADTLPIGDRLILDAAAFAEQAHRGQERKYDGGPYIYHPGRVASRTALLPGATPEMVAAAWLHDTVEDCEVEPEDLRARFGDTVTRLVHELTQPSYTRRGELRRAERTSMDVAFFATISREAKCMKMLDRLDNLADMQRAPIKFLRTYVQESYALAEAIGDGDAELYAELVDRIDVVAAHVAP